MNGVIAQRVEGFCEREGLDLPILMAPMAGACPVGLAQAVGNAGGMGACGALLLEREGILQWARQMREGSNGAFQMNLWIPDPEPERNPDHEAELRGFLTEWGPDPGPDAGDGTALDFEAQCAALIEAGPSVVSSIMGVYPEEMIQKMKARGIRWYATVTTVAEARQAAEAGADVLVAQGSEAGGHRGAFEADQAAHALVGTFSLVPAVVDAVDLPVVATGGIADARGVAAALALGASAVQIGSGLLRTPEAGISPVWAEAMGQAAPEDTAPTRAFSGRLGRALRTDYVSAAETGPSPAPYPIQRNLTGAMRAEAAKEGNLSAMQAWAGQSAGLASDEPAGDLVRRLWREAQQILSL